MVDISLCISLLNLLVIPVVLLLYIKGKEEFALPEFVVITTLVILKTAIDLLYDQPGIMLFLDGWLFGASLHTFFSIKEA